MTAAERDVAGLALRRAVVAIARRTPGASVRVDGSGVTILRDPAPVAALTGLVLPDGPVDAARLRALAAALHLQPGSEPTMVLRTAALDHDAAGSGTETYHRVRTPDERREWSGLADTAFGMPAGSSAALMSPSIVEAPGVLPVLARRGGRAVGVGMSARGGRWVGLFSLPTAADVRRSGVGERLVRFLLAEAAAAGARTACLQAGPMARSLYERIGFRDDPIETVSFTADPRR